MAHLFKKLPHLLGTITNLDGAQSMRALVSINAEIHRRERIFNRYEVNHINQYQKKYKAGEAKEPLPHLFLISDEFAELKANQPDFMKELVSIARVGRSLGIHLILATQKPSGVVDDQIWSNSRFKLALKVADRSDSMEMLHTPDAAEITQTGRAYLQVGNNEVYELFQSAWSGADYQPDKDELGIEDHTIYKVNDLGQYEVLNQDLSGLEEIDEIKEVPTELDAIVGHIHDLSQDLAAVPQPWLPPLRERMTLGELESIDTPSEWQKGQRDLELLLGMADIPQKQAQELASINLTQDGNVLLYGSPGTGKTSFLQSTAMDLARKHSPKDLTLYLLDFGTNGLAPLSKLPHVADTLLLDQTEKVAKFVRIMESELNRRKKLLSEYGVGTISLYRETSGKEEPHLVILLDSFESMKEEAFEPALFKLLMRISREGLSIGVHLVMTAGRQSNLRAILYANFKHQLTLKQNDVTEIRNIVGSTPLAQTMEDTKGRILMKRDQVDVVQLALPVSGDNDIQVIQNLREAVVQLENNWTGARPSGIPMVPEELSFASFEKRLSDTGDLTSDFLPLGLDFEEVRGQGFTFDQLKQLAYMVDTYDHLESITHHLLEVTLAFLPEVRILLLDAEGTFSQYEDRVKTYRSAGEKMASMGKQLVHEVESRQQSGKRTPWFVFIPNLETFVSESKITEEEIKFLYSKAHKVGMYLIIGGTYQFIGVNISPIAKVVKGNTPHFLLGMRLSDQNFLDKVHNNKEPRLELDEVHLHNRKTSIKLKITRQY